MPNNQTPLSSSVLHPDQIKVLDLPIGVNLLIVVVDNPNIRPINHRDIGYATVTPEGFSFSDLFGTSHPDGYQYLSDLASRVAFRIGGIKTFYWWSHHLWVPTADKKLTLTSPTQGRWGDF